MKLGTEPDNFKVSSVCQFTNYDVNYQLSKPGIQGGTASLGEGQNGMKVQRYILDMRCPKSLRTLKEKCPIEIHASDSEDRSGLEIIKW